MSKEKLNKLLLVNGQMLYLRVQKMLFFLLRVLILLFANQKVLEFLLEKIYN
jgi:hypothetical protein